jgi:hypothetical protein
MPGESQLYNFSWQPKSANPNPLWPECIMHSRRTHLFQRNTPCLPFFTLAEAFEALDKIRSDTTNARQKGKTDPHQIDDQAEGGRKQDEQILATSDGTSDDWMVFALETNDTGRRKVGNRAVELK